MSPRPEIDWVLKLLLKDSTVIISIYIKGVLALIVIG